MNSKRGDRTVSEKEVVKKFIMSRVTCLPVKVRIKLIGHLSKQRLLVRSLNSLGNV